MKNLLAKIESIAREQNAGKIQSIRVKLGALCNISPEHFRQHFFLGNRGTVAEYAELTIIVSEDATDPLAQQILLESIEIAE